MSYVMRMTKSAEFAELLKAIYRDFEENPEEAERSQIDRVSEFFSSRDSNLVVHYARIENQDFVITTKELSLEVNLHLSKDEPYVDVHYNRKIVEDRDGLLGAFREAGYDVYEVRTSRSSKLMKGKKTQNGKTNLLHIQIYGTMTVFSAGEHVDIADFELLEKFLVDYEPESSV